MRDAMAVLAVLGTLFGVLLVGAYLITSDGDSRGVLGLLLLTLAGLFLQHRWLSKYFTESERLLAQRVYRLEEQFKASRQEPTT
jgi:hypothetical protein